MNRVKHIMVPVTDRLSLSLSNGGRHGPDVSEVALMFKVSARMAARIGGCAGFERCTTRIPGLFSGLNDGGPGGDGSIEYCSNAEMLTTLIAKAREIGGVYIEAQPRVAVSNDGRFEYIDLTEEVESI